MGSEMCIRDREGAGNSEAFLESDKEFHTLLLVASGNEMFAALAEPIMNVLEGRTRYGIMPDEPAVETMRIHLTIAEAIAEGDAQAAQAASRDLLTGISEFMQM